MTLRKGPGQPPRTDKPTKVAVYLPRTLATALKVHAAKTGTSMSRTVERLLREFLKRRST